MGGDVTVSTLGALTALVIAIVLILRKVSPAYGMLAGAFIGGLVGGVDVVQTVNVMMEGAKDMIPAVLRIMAAGVLAGVLIESGAALSIAEAIVKKTWRGEGTFSTRTCNNDFNNGGCFCRCSSHYSSTNRTCHCQACKTF